MKKVLKWPLIVAATMLGGIILWAIIYSMLGNDPTLFASHVNTYYLILVILIGLIFIPLLLKLYKSKKLLENQLPNILFIIIFGVCLSLFYNTLVFNLNKVFSFTNLYDGSTNIIYSLIATGLIGPILEELLFRGIVYNELKAIYPNMKSILLCSFIFALFHFTGVQMIYAFGLSFLLIYVYEKYKSIKAPIILHMTSNITTTLFLPFLIKDNFNVNISIMILSLIILVLIFYLKMYKKEK